MRRAEAALSTETMSLMCICYLFLSILSCYWTVTHCKDVESHPAWSILSEFECGDSAADRIIGGTNAALGQLPWIVRLGYVVGYEPELEWLCGGALITDKHVVTAAHCAQTPPDDELKLSVVRIGEYNTRTNPDCELSVCAPPLQDRKPLNIKIHPNFNNPAFHNDIAVIQLDEPVQLNDYVAPICLPKGKQIGDVNVGDMVTVAGWGKVNMTTQEMATLLQVLSIPIVKAEICDTFGKMYKMQESAICAGAQKERDTCAGDSGGPLMKVFDTPEGPKTYLMGVVSFGPNICGIKKPGVYSSVSYYLRWILDSIVK